MERYACSTRCRHRSLVEYFGQPFDAQTCGACDWCLKELDPVPDATTVARKILSCVARLEQRWGMGHVADVLLGRANDKVSAQRHDQLSTFALLAHESPSAVRGFIEQLVAEGMLARDGEPYPVLRLTAAGVTLLKGGGSCALYREVVPPKAKGRQRSRAAQSGAADPELFDVLRNVRLRLARDRGVPPYVIFHDRTLQEMADRRPRTLDDLHEIYGVGARKAADFGDAFLDAIRTFRKPD
jgi:ATP-dependent DNA helicase RecQ